MEFIKLSCVMITVCLGVQLASAQGAAAEVVNARVGETATLTGPVTMNIVTSTWYKGTVGTSSQLICTHIISTPGQINGSQYTGRETCAPDGSLEIRDLLRNDTGNYTASVQPTGIPEVEATRQLRVYENLSTPSLVNISGLDYDGYNMTLKCEGGNQTVEGYLFLKDEKNLTCDQQRLICAETSPFLHFQPIRRSDSGTYTCRIYNPVSSNTSQPLEIRVKDPISNVIITSNVTSGHLWENEGSVKLTCSAMGTDPIFSWMYNGSALPQDPRYHLSPDKSSLVISPVTRRDAGPFVCSASNLVNNQSGQQFLLDISYPISSVSISSNGTSGRLWENEGSVNLTCSALGTDPIFSWTFNGNALPQDPRYHLSLDGSSLAISLVNRRDAGSFVCTASNPANNQSSQPLLLTISWRPSGGIQCRAQSVSDSHVELSCSWPEGSPPAQVRLYLPPSIEEGADNEVKRNVPRSEVTPNMNLTCSGAQEGYNDTCFLALRLPQDPGFDNATSTVPGGEPVVLEVNLLRRSSSRGSSAGILPATFTWFNGTSNIPSGGRVEITSNASFSQMRIPTAMESDSGDYVCRAENLLGVTSFSFRVQVSPAPVPPTTPGGLSAGAIAGIVVGVLAVVVVVGVTVYCVLKKKKDKKLGTSNRNESGDPNVLQMKDTPKQDEVNYAVLKFNNTNVQIPQPDYPNASETVYAQVKKK